MVASSEEDYRAQSDEDKSNLANRRVAGGSGWHDASQVVFAFRHHRKDAIMSYRLTKLRLSGIDLRNGLITLAGCQYVTP